MPRELPAARHSSPFSRKDVPQWYSIQVSRQSLPRLRNRSPRNWRNNCESNWRQRTTVQRDRCPRASLLAPFGHVVRVSRKHGTKASSGGAHARPGMRASTLYRRPKNRTHMRSWSRRAVRSDAHSPSPPRHLVYVYMRVSCLCVPARKRPAILCTLLEAPAHAHSDVSAKGGIPMMARVQGLLLIPLRRWSWRNVRVTVGASPTRLYRSRRGARSAPAWSRPRAVTWTDSPYWIGVGS